MLFTRQMLTKLEDSQIKQLELMRAELNLNKSDFIGHVLDKFESSLKKKSKYELRYTDYDRVRLYNYTCNLSEDLHQRLNILAKELKTSKVQLVREILLSYLETSKG